MKIAFIITRKRNNVVVLFATLKVQSFMLTEVRNCDLLIVVTSSTFLKRKDTLKENRQLAQIMYMCMSVYMYSYTFIYTCVWVYICTCVGAFCLFVLSILSTTCACITGVS